MVNATTASHTPLRSIARPVPCERQRIHMTDSPSRICSLLPSATEIVYALGLGDRLVAVTHECDYPPEACEKPHITRSAIDSAGLSAAEIDQAVRDSLADQETIYHLDEELLARLSPDLIL